MTRIDTAVILAAGLGSRLGDLKEEKPKAFVKIDGVSLIERSIQLLKSKGISKIHIGTGYKSEYFDALSKIYPEVTTRRNTIFDRTGSMYTLYVLRDLIEKPFLLLEGDLLYEPGALDHVLTNINPDVILASDATHSGDEVYIQCNEQGFLQNMNKNAEALNSISGELVGISKLSLEGFKAMIDFAEQKYDEDALAIHYEDAMVGAASQQSFYVNVVNDLAWCEIDDASHLERAQTIVYPKIRERGQV